MKSKKCKFALVQHPMILLVHEDRGEPTVGERIGPWGAPDIETYADRVRRNLEAMKNYPDLKLNYEFSAIELQILAENAPDIIPVMREMIAQKRLSFLGGDYSQAHGQLYSGELNYRQIDIGLAVFERIVGYRVVNNFHQETCLHDQLPQLLKAFGFETASPPTFSHALVPLYNSQPHLVDSDDTGYLPIAGESTALWHGLDGTEIPTVIVGVSTCGFNTHRTIVEEHKGLYRSSRIIITAPDMQEIDADTYNFIKARGETVLLDEALLNEVNHQKPSWKLKLNTYWAYSEGQMAEAVYRKIRETESMLLAEEAQTVALRACKRENFDLDIETLLTAMHHDIHWIEVTDLKDKYLKRMDEVLERSKNHLAKLVGANSGIQIDNNMIRVVNTLPYERNEIVRFTLEGLQSVAIRSINGENIATLCIPSSKSKNSVDVLFKAFVPAFGITDYFMDIGISDLKQGEECNQAEIKAGDSVYVVESNGTVKKAKVNDNNILSGSGHDLRYLKEDGEIVGGNSRTGTMKRYTNEDIDVLRISSTVGDISIEIEYIACPINKYLNISTQFNFDSNQIGLMWEDWTKLNSYWPVDGSVIRYDIPYGIVDGNRDVPLYAPSWISVQGENGKLVVMNTGTPKHFVEDGVIGCVLAWGGNVYSNRMHLDWLDRNHYDLSLKGTQTIRSGIMATKNETTEAEISRSAQCLNSPLLTFGITDAAENISNKWGLDFSNIGLVVTAVLEKDGRTVCRFFEAEGRSHSIQEICKSIGYKVNITDLIGENLQEITPYRIGYLML